MCSTSTLKYAAILNLHSSRLAWFFHLLILPWCSSCQWDRHFCWWGGSQWWILWLWGYLRQVSANLFAELVAQCSTLFTKTFCTAFTDAYLVTLQRFMYAEITTSRNSWSSSSHCCRCHLYFWPNGLHILHVCYTWLFWSFMQCCFYSHVYCYCNQDNLFWLRLWLCKVDFEFTSMCSASLSAGRPAPIFDMLRDACCITLHVAAHCTDSHVYVHDVKQC